MKLKELINKYEWKQIYPRMKNLYSKPKKNLKGYKGTFQELKMTGAKPQGKRKILIELEPRYNQNNDNYHTHVHGITPKRRGKTYALIQQFNKWLGMEVCKATLITYSEIDIICHCLYEMTFCGFSSEDVENFMNK